MERVQAEPRLETGPSVRMTLGRRIVCLTLTAIEAADGRSLGTAVDWHELTDELAVAMEARGYRLSGGRRPGEESRP